MNLYDIYFDQAQLEEVKRELASTRTEKTRLEDKVDTLEAAHDRIMQMKVELLIFCVFNFLLKKCFICLYLKFIMILFRNHKMGRLVT
jgi:hypothetical protein